MITKVYRCDICGHPRASEGQCASHKMTLSKPDEQPGTVNIPEGLRDICPNCFGSGVVQRFLPALTNETERQSEYVLVPRVPTPVMLKEGWFEVHDEDAAGAWRVMIEAWEKETGLCTC
jgi:hypothetical protein